MLKILLFFIFGIIIGDRFSTITAINQPYRLCRFMSISKEDMKKIKTDIKDGENGYIYLNDATDDSNFLYVLVPKANEFEINRKVQRVLKACHDLDSNIDVNALRIHIADLNRSDPTDYSFQHYHQLSDTYRWLKHLAQIYNDKIQLIDLGKSYNYNDIHGVKISYKSKSSTKAIFIEGGTHGQEWIGSAVVNYLIKKLLTTTDSQWLTIIENYDWYLVPHINPDGYIHTFESARFWRKTISRQENCMGVDLNRNWGFNFSKELDISKYPCINEYPGIRPASEVETQALMNYLNRIKDNLYFYMTIDGPDRKIYMPNNTETIRNYDELKHIIDHAVDMIRQRSGTNYSGVESKRFQPLSGTSMDWVYENLNVNYSFTFHLPPAFEFPEREFINAKFLMPSSRIAAIGEEVFLGLMEMIKKATPSPPLGGISNGGSSQPLSKIHRYFDTQPDNLLDDY